MPLRGRRAGRCSGQPEDVALLDAGDEAAEGVEGLTRYPHDLPATRVFSVRLPAGPTASTCMPAPAGRLPAETGQTGAAFWVCRPNRYQAVSGLDIQARVRAKARELAGAP